MNLKLITTTYEAEKAVTQEGAQRFYHDSGVEMEAVNFYPEITYQTVQGFGGSLTEACGYTFSRMSDSSRKKILDAYFGANSSNYCFLRMSIDSCDFSLGNYSAIVDPEDTELKSFSLKREEQYIFPLLEAAQQAAGVPLNIMLTPWSPPAFMKSNGQKNGGGFLKPEYRMLWAQYICRYIKEYQNRGYFVGMLSIQNEPNAVQKWDSCIFTSEQEKEFLRDYLYPALQKNGLGEIKVCIWDHNKERAFERACDILDRNTDKMVQGIAFHWYSGDHFDAVKLIRDKFPDKTLVFSEGCVEYSRFDVDDQLSNAQMYAHDMVGNLNAGMNISIDWNIILDETGGPNHVGNYCDAPIMCNTETDTVETKLSYTYISHFSRYIQPGAKRIATSQYTDKLEVTAFLNPDSGLVAVLLNRSVVALPVALRLQGYVAQFLLPGGSITTALIDRRE